MKSTYKSVSYRI